MILFFSRKPDVLYAVQVEHPLSKEDDIKLRWLLGEATAIDEPEVKGTYIGPRATMVSPWSTNAVEITQNMGIRGIGRMEPYLPLLPGQSYDFLLYQRYDRLGQDLFDTDRQPEPIVDIHDIAAYNEVEGLSLSAEEVAYLDSLSDKLGRPLTDSEVFGFSQVNSEHCRHKIFNGTFVIDGAEMPLSLFELIKQTSQQHPNGIISAYRDNVAFTLGPAVQQFAPSLPGRPSAYSLRPFDSVLSLKAETHNFPTTVEPFNGAATGTGGEIRDRMAGGQGSIPLAGSAVYMTPYSRVAEGHPWEENIAPRKWLYQTPVDILIKASNGASDFGNKFGQPLILGSVLTFEHEEEGQVTGYDKVIMMAGGVGYAKREQALKCTPTTGDIIVVMGGDNYRIGMGGAAVSSSDTGAFDTSITLNAVQRSNPEMQKRIANAIRALVEHSHNPVLSIHDHGAGGHLNCLSELVEETGGVIYLDALPIGDNTLSAKEIIGNESQERMGLILHPEDIPLLREIAQRERAPMYEVGVVTGDMQFRFVSRTSGEQPIDLSLNDLFGSSPKTVMRDRHVSTRYAEVVVEESKVLSYLDEVLQLEAVCCKDWLTNKVDRCVSGRVALQQCAGPLQLPLNNCGVVALDYTSHQGIATSIGHAPIVGLIDPAIGGRMSIAEALTNIIWAPLKEGISSISLSANWMWPCHNPGQDARLYQAVKAVSEFAIQLGINIPTGKDSLSMAQKYPEQTVLAPGTVIISAMAHCCDITRTVTPVLELDKGPLLYLDLSGDDFHLGGSSLAQSLSKVGRNAPDIADPMYFAKAFNAVQEAIKSDRIVAGHDISAGGMITTLLEMCFPSRGIGLDLQLDTVAFALPYVLFSEKSGLILQARDETLVSFLEERGIAVHPIGRVVPKERILLNKRGETLRLDINHYRDLWYSPSRLLDQRQTAGDLANVRFANYKNQPLEYIFPTGYKGEQRPLPEGIPNRPVAAVVREKGSNSEREMAHALFFAGFEVRDVHMTDLITGRADLKDVQFLGAVGGFSNSDVLGSAKGWAGAFKYNPKAKAALEQFFRRPDTLSIGICNGCQLFLELDLINPDHPHLAKMTFNDSRKHESAFTSVNIEEGNSIMMRGLEGCRLGVWISHGEGKFALPMPENDYNIIAKYGYCDYPANPNGSDYNTAMLASDDGRHLVTMPHIERSIFPWNWAYYPSDRADDAVSPWLRAFENAFDWIVEHSSL